MNFPDQEGTFEKNHVFYKHGSILKATEKYILNSCAARGDGNDVMYS